MWKMLDKYGIDKKQIDGITISIASYQDIFTLSTLRYFKFQNVKSQNLELLECYNYLNISFTVDYYMSS